MEELNGTSCTCHSAQSETGDAVSVLLSHESEHAVVATIGLLGYRQALARSPDLSRTTSWLPRSELPTARSCTCTWRLEIIQSMLSLRLDHRTRLQGLHRTPTYRTLMWVSTWCRRKDCGVRPSSSLTPRSEDQLHCGC